MKGLTLFVPVLNEEEILLDTMPRLLRAAEECGLPLQLLVADNGSTDRTPELLRRLAADDERVTALRLPEPGVGAALRESLPHVRHDVVIAVDADLSIGLDFMARACAEMAAGADVVVGAKAVGVEKRPLHRLLVSRLFAAVVTKGLGLPCHDASIGAKAWRTSFLREHADLIGRGSSYVLELLVAAQREGLDLREIPVSCHDTRASHFPLIAEGIHRFGHLFRLLLRERLGSPARAAVPARETRAAR